MIRERIELRRERKRRRQRIGCLVDTFYNISFRRPLWKGDDNRYKWISNGLDYAARDNIISSEERDALKAYAMLRIFKRVDSELVLKADSSIVRRLMNEVGFTYS